MIHKEGKKISIHIFLVLAIINSLIFIFTGPCILAWTFLIISAGFMIFVLRFFRNPTRSASFEEGIVYSPADGLVVVVEETTEEEYFHDRRIQISVFMSVWNVHINWFPIIGSLSYFKYHPGKYLLARHPKSSTQNERNTTVIKTENGKDILVRQIAGIAARRIISYASEGLEVKPGDELGFIRFGSRVDIFLPLDSKILVSPGQKVRGLGSALAELP